MRQHYHTLPEIGNWYNSKEFPECFQVVALDELQALIEIQYLDGEVTELDFDSWVSSHPQEIAEPEDASAPYELDPEDMLEMLHEIDNSRDGSLDDQLLNLDKDDSRWS